jgi:hypothetical protein
MNQEHHYPETPEQITLYIRLDAERRVYFAKRNRFDMPMSDALEKAKKQYEYDISVGDPRFSIEELLLPDKELMELYEKRKKQNDKKFIQDNPPENE